MSHSQQHRLSRLSSHLAGRGPPTTAVQPAPTLLKGIDPILTADLLYLLRSAGHGADARVGMASICCTFHVNFHMRGDNRTGERCQPFDSPPAMFSAMCSVFSARGRDRAGGLQLSGAVTGCCSAVAICRDAVGVGLLVHSLLLLPRLLAALLLCMLSLLLSLLAVQAAECATKTITGKVVELAGVDLPAAIEVLPEAWGFLGQGV